MTRSVSSWLVVGLVAGCAQPKPAARSNPAAWKAPVIEAPQPSPPGAASLPAWTQRASGPCLYLGKPALCGIGRVEKIKNQRLALDTAKKQSVGHVLDMLFAFGYYLERHYPGRAQIRGALPHSDDGCYLPRCSGWIYLAKERGGYWEEAWDPDTPAAYVFSGITLEGIRDWVVNPDDQYCRPKGDEIDFVAANLDEVYARWASNPADPPPPPPRPTANTPFFACRDGHYLVHLDGLEAPEAELTTLENWDLEQIRTDFIARTGAPESAQVRVLAWRVLQAPGSGC